MQLYSFKGGVKKWLITIAVFLATAFLSLVARAQNDTTGYRAANQRYNLFHPVPKNKMKEMETDRPDVTESAYTVAPGHFQMESDLFRYVRNKNRDTISTAIGYNLGNYKLGLSERADMQLVVPTYVNNSIRERSTSKIISRSAGLDHIILRFKYNLWGYAGGKTALAALPFLSFPTSAFAHNGVQGGIVFPFAWQLKEGLGFGSQAEMDIVKEDDNNYHVDFLYSATCSKSISSKVNVFAEGVASISTYRNNTDVYANGGIIFSISENVNVDAGINYGVNRGADKIFFTGFSFRL